MIRLVIQSGTVLRSLANVLVRRLIDPDDVKTVAGVVVNIAAQCLDNVVEFLVLPAVFGHQLAICHEFIHKRNVPNENVALAVIVLYDILDTIRVIPVARHVNLHSKIISKRLNGVICSLSGAAFC